jgi:hypothetical protein
MERGFLHSRFSILNSAFPFAVGYRLSAIGYRLFAIGYLPPSRPPGDENRGDEMPVL